VRGLWRGTSLALVGVGNGAIQFMAYEEMKRWGFERKKRQFAKQGREYTTADDKLVSLTLSTRIPLYYLPSTGQVLTCVSAVKYFVHLHVRCRQTLRPWHNVPVPSRPFPNPKQCHHAPVPYHTCVHQTYVCGRGLQGKYFLRIRLVSFDGLIVGGLLRAFIVALERTSSAFFLERALRSWCTRTSHGCSGHRLQKAGVLAIDTYINPK
jgi:hypothetical protein